MSHYTLPFGRCRSCGARVEWVTTVRGKKMPLNPEPSDRTTVAGGEPGNVVIRDEVAHALAPGSSINTGEVLRVPHLASCPEQQHGARGRPTTVDRDHKRLDEEAAQAAERDTKVRSAIREAGRHSETAGGKERPPAKTLFDVRTTLVRFKAVLDGLMRDIENIERQP